MYYNTTNESGQALAEYKQKARNQDGIILELFNSGKYDKGLTASEAWQLLRCVYPITSVRRSFHTLTGLKLINKTKDKRQGPWGRSEYVWRKV